MQSVPPLALGRHQLSHASQQTGLKRKAVRAPASTRGRRGNCRAMNVHSKAQLLNLTRRSREEIASRPYVLLLGSLLAGSYVLEFFGITLPIVRVAGGLVVSTQRLGRNR
jgi:hypothetical protein